MHLFGPLPDGAIFDLTDGVIGVRLAVPDDANPLYELLADPDMPHVRQVPNSPKEVRSWVENMAELAPEELPERTILFAVTRDGDVVGSLTAQLAWLAPSGASDGDVPSVEYTGYRLLTVDGIGSIQRAGALVEPKLIEHFGVEVVFALVHETNEDAASALAGFELVMEFDNGDRLYRRPVLVHGRQE